MVGSISLEGAVWRGIDHLGCSGLLGRFVEGGVQGRGLHVIGPDLRRQGPTVRLRSMCPPWGLAASFCPSLVYSGLG